MNQADVSKLISQLKIKINPRHRNLKNIDGPEGRLKKLRKTVTALFKFERIELNFNRADEARGYAELLISEARKYGDCHRSTMEMADFWLLEKQLVHKLFKVLVPRYENYNVSYTRMYRASMGQTFQFPRAVLELRGNPYPSLTPDSSNNRNLLHNILLDEAKKEYRAQKYIDMAEKLSSTQSEVQASPMLQKSSASFTVEEDSLKSSATDSELLSASISESETVGSQEEKATKT